MVIGRKGGEDSTSNVDIAMSRRCAFVLRHTRLQRPSQVPEVQLHLADEVTALWRVMEERAATDIPPPYWAVAWIGGQAIARYLLDRPEEVVDKRVIDFATGSGLCGIAAMKAGASRVLAADIDIFCAAAVALNARANEVCVAFTDRNLLDGPPPEADVIVAGDICYEQSMAAHILSWLRAAHAQGIRVLIGDPGRAYCPREGLIRLADYEVKTTRELEGVVVKRVGVFTFPA